MIDGTDPDIAAFADNGGKLLIWYGLGDTCVSLYRTAEYFDTVKQRLGASKVQGFARMVTSPSNGHDLDGVGTEPRSIDLLAAMDAWVEKGAAPDKLVATKFAPGTSTPWPSARCASTPSSRATTARAIRPRLRASAARPPECGGPSKGSPQGVSLLHAVCGFTAPGRSVPDGRPAGAPGARKTAGLRPGWGGR